MASSVARIATAADNWRSHSRVGGRAAIFSGPHHVSRNNSFAPPGLKDATVRQQQRGDVPSTSSSSSSAASARNGKTAVSEDDMVSSATEQHRQSQALDQWAAHQAREMVTTIERQAQQAEIPKQLANSQPASANATSLLDEMPHTNPNSTGSTLTAAATPNPKPTGRNKRPNVRASSLIQMWRDLEAEAGISPKQRTVSGGFSNGESSASNSFSMDEPSRGNWDDECDAFADWSSDAITTADNSAASSMNESEKSRVGSIVKKLTTAPSNENDAPPSPTAQQKWGGAMNTMLGLRLLRGRGQMERFVARMEQERQREIVAVASRQYVSRFPYRGRMQSMLKLRSLRRKEAVEDQMRAPSPHPRSQREKGSAISSIRERFDRGHHSSSSRKMSLGTSASIQVQFPINNEASNFLMSPKREEVYACSTDHFNTDTLRYQEIEPPLTAPTNHLISETTLYRQVVPLLPCSPDQLPSDTSSPRFGEIVASLPCLTDHLTSDTSSPRYRQIGPRLTCPTNQLSPGTSPRYRRIAVPPPYPTEHFSSCESSPRFGDVAPPLPCTTNHLISNASPRYRQIASALQCSTNPFASDAPPYHDISPPFPSSIEHSTSDASQRREMMPLHPCQTDQLAFNISQYQEITALPPYPADHFTFNTSRYQEIVPPLPSHNDNPQYQETATPEAPMHTQSNPNLPHPTMTVKHLQEESRITSMGGSWDESNMWVGNSEAIPSKGWQNEVVAEEMESFPQQNMSIWFGEQSSSSWRCWRVQRRPLDQNFSDKAEIRELLESRRVSKSLESDFCNKMNQMLLSFLHQQESQNNYEEEENNVDYSYWQTGVEEDQNVESTTSSLVPLHNQTMQQPQTWQHHEPIAHLSSQDIPDIDVMKDMRNDMAKIREEISELRVMIESCIEWKSKLRQTIKQDMLEAIQQTVGTASSSANFGTGSARKGTCCICCEVQVDSLLYRCGHMSTCFNCAHQLKWSSGKCPICRSPIVDVVRIFPNS